MTNRVPPPTSRWPPQPHHLSPGPAPTCQPGPGLQKFVWQVRQQPLGWHAEKDGGDGGQQAPAHVAAKKTEAELRGAAMQCCPPQPGPPAAVHNPQDPRPRHLTAPGPTATHASPWKRRAHTNSSRALPMGTATCNRHTSGQGSRCQRPLPQGPQGATRPPRGKGGGASLPGLGRQALTTVFTARYIRAPKVWASLPRTSWSSPKRSKVTTGLQQNPAMMPARRSGLAPRPPGPQRDPRPGGPSSPHVLPRAARGRQWTDTPSLYRAAWSSPAWGRKLGQGNMWGRLC